MKRLVFFAVVLLIFIVYIIYQRSEIIEVRNSLDFQSVEIKRLKYQLNFMDLNLLEFPNEEIFNIGGIKVKNSSEEVAALFEFLSDQNLIFRIDQYHCNTCYEAEFKVLSQFQDLSNLVILTSMSSRQFKYFEEKFSNISENVLFLNIQDKFSLPQDRMGQPYYIRVDRNLTILETFIPDKLLSDFSIKYLSSRSPKSTMN